MEPLIVPLIQAPAGGLWAGFNAFFGSANLPTNVFLSHIIIRNENIHTGAPDTVTWTFPNCFIYFKRKPELENELLYSGEVSNTHQFVPSGTADSLRYGGAKINISFPIPADSVEPTLFISMEETAAAVTYTPLVMEIHYTTYLHPVSHSGEFQRLSQKIDDTHSNGLRFAGIYKFTATRSASSFFIGTTTIPADEVWEITHATLTLNGAQTWHLTGQTSDDFPIVRVTAAWTPVSMVGSLWMERGDQLGLREITDGATCAVVVKGIKWKTL